MSGMHRRVSILGVLGQADPKQAWVNGGGMAAGMQPAPGAMSNAEAATAAAAAATSAAATATATATATR